MKFDFGFYSSLLLIFFVHTFVYALLFWIKYRKQQQPSAFWLGLFLLLAALYIAPWMLGFAGWYGHQPYRDLLFYVPFQHLFLIGPCVFFYVQSLLNPSFRLTKKRVLHFLPALLYVLLSLVIMVYDRLIAKEYYFLKSQQDPDFDSWYQSLGFVSMIIYFIASIRYYNNYKRVIVEVISNAADFLFLWVRNFLVAFLAILLAWMALAVFGFFYSAAYVDSWWYFFSFALICYYIAIAGYANAVESKVFFKTSLFSNQNQILFLPDKPSLALQYSATDFVEIESTEEKDSLEVEFNAWKQKIEALLLNERIYTVPELTLFDLAKKLNTNVSYLSRVINKSFGLNFNDLINQYRVQAVIDLLKKGEHKKQTLLALAFECDFNSKSTFNRAFKKSTGQSPHNYTRNT